MRGPGRWDGSFGVLRPQGLLSWGIPMPRAEDPRRSNPVNLRLLLTPSPADSAPAGSRPYQNGSQQPWQPEKADVIAQPGWKETGAPLLRAPHPAAPYY